MSRRLCGRISCIVFIAFVLVFTAGCVGLLGTDNEPSTEEHSPTSTPDDTPTPTEATSSTPTATPEQDLVASENPFGQEHVPVYLNDTEDRDMEPIVKQGLWYWENNSEEYAGYPIDFTLVEATSPHRIEIGFKNRGMACGYSYSVRTTGCSVLNDETAPEITEIWIARGFTPHFTNETVIHELGHALGVTHGEEPEELMSPTHPSGITRDTIRVYITHNTGPLTQARKGAVQNALEYFETHPELTGQQSVSWKEVRSVEQADLIIEYDESGCFEDGAGSCSGDAEYSDQSKVVLDSMNIQTVDWHVAFQLAPAFFDDHEIPEELTSDTSREERARWN